MEPLGIWRGGIHRKPKKYWDLMSSPASLEGTQGSSTTSEIPLGGSWGLRVQGFRVQDLGCRMGTEQVG